MHLYNYNEMFILALVALSIVGVICLGLLIVLTIFVLGRKREKEQQRNPPPANTTETSEKQILDKLNSIQKDQKKSSALSNASFGLALIAIAFNGILNTTRLDIIVIGVIIGIIGLAGFIWNIARWRY